MLSDYTQTSLSQIIDHFLKLIRHCDDPAVELESSLRFNDADHLCSDIRVGTFQSLCYDFGIAAYISVLIGLFLVHLIPFTAGGAGAETVVSRRFQPCRVVAV